MLPLQSSAPFQRHLHRSRYSFALTLAISFGPLFRQSFQDANVDSSSREEGRRVCRPVQSELAPCHVREVHTGRAPAHTRTA